MRRRAAIWGVDGRGGGAMRMRAAAIDSGGRVETCGGMARKGVHKRIESRGGHRQRRRRCGRGC